MKVMLRIVVRQMQSSFELFVMFTSLILIIDYKIQNHMKLN